VSRAHAAELVGRMFSHAISSLISRTSKCLNLKDLWTKISRVDQIGLLQSNQSSARHLGRCAHPRRVVLTLCSNLNIMAVVDPVLTIG
jgi:hypothetical protein